ncbi:MAG TPA: carbonic anhydrase family protein [Ferruginibacter sp.]|nr:carbonic anhydrase family protein [Ferruginibacter sp.]HRO06937.1 carbonic anhydrase family protein [Ferruginibacter sp.]HRO95740.1 carbonic anhydrase family protein [Ferruginibacter sp.]HRP49251.1 carbonic anhydrase family protein [Ferruginibacter sp.]
MAKSSLIFTAFVALSLMGCNNQPQNSGSENNPVIDQPKALVEEVLTKEQRDALTPDEIIQAFKDGNERFIKNELTTRDHSAQIRKSASGQFPKAVILSCLDSRVPVEDVFDRGIGDIFVGRVAGNFVNVDLLGSMEFGCKVAGAKVILVLGHEHCGAVKSAIDDVKLGNITAMLSKIRPAVEKVSYEGDRTSGNPEFVHKVCESNVKHTIEQIRQNSPILKEMEDLGQIKIVGAVYDMDSGKVTFL